MTSRPSRCVSDAGYRGAFLVVAAGGAGGGEAGFEVAGVGVGAEVEVGFDEGLDFEHFGGGEGGAVAGGGEFAEFVFDGDVGLDADEGGPGEEPLDGELGHGGAVGVLDVAEFFDFFEAVGEPVFVAEFAVVVEGLIGLVDVLEDAGGVGDAGDDAAAILFGGDFAEFASGVLFEHVEDGLHGGAGGPLLESDDAFVAPADGGSEGDAPVADFSRLGELVHGGEEFVGHVGEFEVVGLVEIDVVGLQALEGFFEGEGDEACGEILFAFFVGASGAGAAGGAGVGVEVVAELGGEDEIGAAGVFDGGDQHGFGAAVTVGVTGVEEVDAEIDGEVLKSDAFGFIGGGFAPHVRAVDEIAEGEGGDAESGGGDEAGLHGGSGVVWRKREGGGRGVRGFYTKWGEIENGREGG